MYSARRKGLRAGAPFRVVEAERYMDVYSDADPIRVETGCLGEV